MASIPCPSTGLNAFCSKKFSADPAASGDHVLPEVVSQHFPSCALRILAAGKPWCGVRSKVPASISEPQPRDLAPADTLLPGQAEPSAHLK